MRPPALLLVTALTAALPQVARAVEADPLLARLDKSTQAVESLAGEFSQTSHLKLFKQDLTSHGRFFYRRPRQIRWEYLDPDPSVLVLDGDRATLAMPGAPPQVFDLTRDATMRAVFDQLTMWLGAGSLSRAKQDYELAAGGSDAAPTLALTPRAGAKVAKAFARIELRFDKQLLLRGIVLKEPSGDEKEIVFTRMERNAKLPPNAFTP